MVMRKYKDPVCITVRLERVQWNIARKIMVFQDEFQARINERLPKVLMEDSTGIDPQDIHELIRLQTLKIEEEQQIAQYYLEIEQKRKELESQKKEKEQQDRENIRARDERERKLIERNELVKLFYSLCRDVELFSKDEALDYAERLYHSRSDDEEAALVNDLRLKALERLSGMDGQGKPILDLLQADEKPEELIETTITWLEQDYRKGRIA